MKTYFYNRSAKILFDGPPLPAFARLDDIFDKVFSDSQSSIGHQAVLHANNIARRYYDIYYFRFQLEKFQSHDNAGLRAELCATHLVVCIGSFKSLLDAIAICLNDLFDFRLKLGDQDFRKQKFWNVLQNRSATKNKFHHLTNWMKTEVPQWRDFVIHRYSPEIVAVCSVDFPDGTVITNMNQILEAFPPEPRFVNRMTVPTIGGFHFQNTIPPLDFVEKWMPNADELCSIVCDIIGSTLRPSR